MTDLTLKEFAWIFFKRGYFMGKNGHVPDLKSKFEELWENKEAKSKLQKTEEDHKP